MSLLKDIKTTLNKISMQAEKSNLQLEKIISLIKTSIKNIKDSKLNVKDLKINNYKSNEAFEESKLSLNQLLKLTYNYLKNPTPEKALKVKNQINVSNNYLTKTKNIFYNNKTFSDKVVNSFNKYQNDGLINNGKKLIKSSSILIQSVTKLIKNIKLAKFVSKLKTQTRKVYFSESPTLSPDCQTKKEDLEYAIKAGTEAYEIIISEYLKIAAKTLIYKTLILELEKKNYEQIIIVDAIIEDHDAQAVLIKEYKDSLQRVQDDNNNDILKELNLDLAEALEKFDNKKSIDTLDLIANNTKRIIGNFDAYEKAIVDLGSITKESVETFETIRIEAIQMLSENIRNIVDVIEKYEDEVKLSIKKIKDNKKNLDDINYIITVINKYLLENC